MSHRAHPGRRIALARSTAVAALCAVAVPIAGATAPARGSDPARAGVAHSEGPALRAKAGSKLPAEVRRAIARRMRTRGRPLARAASTNTLWYDNGRIGTSATATYVGGYTYINVWNPMIKSINGLSSQRVAFRSLVYNPSTGASAVSDWWVGTTLNWGSYSGPGFLGGFVYNLRTGVRNNGDGAMLFKGVGGGWWAYMWVEWHTSTGGLDRQVGFWLQ